MNTDQPALIVHYTDQVEGFNGWLVVDRTDLPLSAGGMRIQKGLTLAHLVQMAGNMSKKMRLCGLPVSGAKCGIDYDPQAPGKEGAVERFIGAIKPFLSTNYSMGPDLNTKIDELDNAAECHGLSCVKSAIARVQGMTEAVFFERYSVLKEKALDEWTLAQIRAGYGVAMAALKMLRLMNIPYEKATVAVQGFGGLGKAALLALVKEGIRVKAIADIDKCIMIEKKDPAVFDWLCNGDTCIPAVDTREGFMALESQAIYSVPCDVLILAAIERAVTVSNAHQLRTRAVIPGANLAVDEEAEKILHDKGIWVIPCFAAGCGGTIAMNALFGPEAHPDPTDVLININRKMSSIVGEIVSESQKENITCREAALRIIDTTEIPFRSRPYAI